MRPVGPDVPAWLAPLLREMQDAIRELQDPTQPVQLAVCLYFDLPPASDWKQCAISVSDKDCIAISTDVAGTWTWLRADGSAI